MKTYTYKTNINCGGCIRAVTPHLNEIESIKSWNVDTKHPDKILKVELQSGSAHDVVEAVGKAGFSAQVQS